MWHISRYNRKEGDSNADNFSLNSCDFSSFVSKCNKTDMFMDCENYDTFKIHTNVLYVFTQYVSLDQTKNIFNTFIKVMDNECKVKYDLCEIRIFINGYEIGTGENDL
jgi:hypothetical protein